MKLTIEQMYDICRRNDASFDGEFYMGVLTTSIYCLPSCKARIPYLRNVRFFQNRVSAIEAGLRGCKRCKSSSYPNIYPNWFLELISHIHASHEIKLTTKDMEKLSGVSASTIRRCFMGFTGFTPHKYQLKLKLEKGKRLLETGIQVNDIPYEVGFQSLSGFRSAYIQYFNENPGGRV